MDALIDINVRKDAAREGDVSQIGALPPIQYIARGNVLGDCLNRGREILLAEVRRQGVSEFFERGKAKRVAYVSNRSVLVADKSIEELPVNWFSIGRKTGNLALVLAG